MSSIHLTSTVRSNLLLLQRYSDALSDTSERLSSGLKVESARDDAEAYYASTGLLNSVDALDSRLDGMSESIEVINATDNGITNIQEYVEQMMGIIDDALATTDADDRRDLGTQFNELINQIRDMAKDSSYDDTNLLYGNDSLTVYLSESTDGAQTTLEGINISAGGGDADDSGEIGASSVVATSVATDASGNTYVDVEEYALTIEGLEGDMIGIKSAGTSGDDWEIDWGDDDYESILSDLEAQLESMFDALTTESDLLQTDLEIISLRQDFTENKVTIYETGADELTAADLDEDAAYLTTLETATSLAVQCLSLASSEAEQALTLLQS